MGSLILVAKAGGSPVPDKFVLYLSDKVQSLPGHFPGVPNLLVQVNVHSGELGWTFCRDTATVLKLLTVGIDMVPSYSHWVAQLLVTGLWDSCAPH